MGRRVQFLPAIWLEHKQCSGRRQGFLKKKIMGNTSGLCFVQVLKPTMFPNPQSAPVSLPTTTLPTSPAFPQALPVPHYSRPALPLGHFANLLSYPILPQSYPYLPPMRQTSSLPQASAISHYGGFGSSSSIPGGLNLTHTTASDMTIGIDEALSQHYREASHFSSPYDLELKRTGILEVKLVQARGLTNKDSIGKSDPFAVLYIRPLRDRTKTSKVINNDLDPIWNEHFEFTVEDVSTQNLTVKIYDDEGLQASEQIGRAQIKLQDLQPGKVKDVWLNLVKDLEVQRDEKDRG